MKPKRFLKSMAILSFFCLMAMGSKLCAISSDPLPETMRVRSIHISGTQILKKKEIRSVLTISPPSAWRTWIQRPTASEEDLSDDAQRISQLYKSNGFYHTLVTYDVHLAKAHSEEIPPVEVTYYIEEGAPVSVDRVAIDFELTATPVSEKQLLELIPLKTGMRFEEKAYRESKQLILKKFGSVGYPLAEITGKAMIYPSTNKAVVTFHITPGQLCYFGDTAVVGDTPVLSEKILTRSRTYEPNEIYDTLKVEKSQRNLYNLDVLKAAVIQPGDPDSVTGRVPMSLELKPKKRQSIKLGVGYGDEDGLRLKAGWTYRNLLGWGGKLNFEAKHTDLLNKASAGYNQPYFWDSRSALQMEVGVLEEFFDSYESRKLFSTNRFTRDMGHRLNLTAAYLLEYNDLRDLNLLDPEEQAAFREDHSFFISSTFWEMIRSSVDSETTPQKGSSISGAIEIASTLLGSQLTYVKPTLEFKKYFQLPWKTTMAGRIKLETISDPENNQEIPIFKRLFLGGANTVRGYGFQKLGPLDAIGNPVGGQSSALANIELRRPIVGVLSGVLFLDMGMVDKEKFHYTTKELRTSAGGGLRVDTPVGPLRLEVGYKLNPQETFSVEGEEAPRMDRWRIHFNFGHTF